MRLIEELNLRTQRLQPLLEKLTDIGTRMDCLRNQLAELKGSAAAANHIAQLRTELRC